jgi:hypothetical protein
MKLLHAFLDQVQISAHHRLVELKRHYSEFDLCERAWCCFFVVHILSYCAKDVFSRKIAGSLDTLILAY